MSPSLQGFILSTEHWIMTMKFTKIDETGIQFQITPDELLLLNSIIQEGRIALNCNLQESQDIEDEIRKACTNIFSRKKQVQ